MAWDGKETCVGSLLFGVQNDFEDFKEGCSRFHQLSHGLSHQKGKGICEYSNRQVNHGTNSFILFFFFKLNTCWCLSCLNQGVKVHCQSIYLMTEFCRKRTPIASQPEIILVPAVSDSELPFIHLLFAVVLGQQQNDGHLGHERDSEHCRTEYTGMPEGGNGYGMKSRWSLSSATGKPPSPSLLLSAFNCCPRRSELSTRREFPSKKMQPA